MSEQWEDVVRREQHQRQERLEHEKYHATQETYRIEQDRARGGELPQDASDAQPGILASIRQAVMRLLGRG